MSNFFPSVLFYLLIAFCIVKMSNSVIQVTCRTNDFPTVESKLRLWDEVEAVGSLREKRNNKGDLTTVIIKLSGDSDSSAVESRLETILEIIRESKEPKQTESKKKKPSRGIDITAEVLAAMPHDAPPASDKNRSNQRRNQNNRNTNHRGRGRGNWQGRGNYQGRENNNEQRQGRQGRYNGRRGRFNYNRLPMVEASAAFVDNVPFGVTNTRLMDMFSPFGHIIDINRLETMAMICYDNPESVQRCIQTLNGSKVNENIITISSGTVRIPEEVVQVLEF